MSSLFDSINAYDVKPFKRMGVTIDEEIYYAKLLMNFLSRFNLNKVLEIACGNCLIFMYARKIAKQIYAIDDWKGEDINKWTKGVKDNVTIVQNLFPLPFRSSFFDAVYSFLYFYNVTKKERKDKIEEIYRVLKSDGILVLADIDIMRSIRKDFLTYFDEVEFYIDQGIFISIMKKKFP
ncbi:class I SAM-dependent methyltransferase [Sulfurisphaera tokodaii]|uniref:Methyltransferase type 11 domain-containing protein n=2 Tax=Sulfurisphaera tokodaii TaxID=111955 RepID=Q973N0_SULTO|nr:class I SAM-dependent methyltransferase [Sulfurisphaera tokodaii]BAB65882.1 hypothetical protein STK_08710 [Sulfurisphaera tokodaii str. 7]HII73444.1 class I SAM-dependent methyltransferase [Sulfurisphaera tokodaii]